jgi:hypothetical protein
LQKKKQYLQGGTFQNPFKVLKWKTENLKLSKIEEIIPKYYTKDKAI